MLRFKFTRKVVILVAIILIAAIGCITIVLLNQKSKKQTTIQTTKVERAEAKPLEFDTE